MVAEERRAGNLPAETARLVGRQEELAQVRRMLRRSRLVTLSGVGGVGKTRLARHVAAAVQPQFRDGVWLVELSALSEGTLLAHVIAEALPLADQTPRPVIEAVAEYLSGRDALLVLDTCEHLRDACALMAEVLLRAAPGLRVLATSRRPLGVVVEEVLTVEPLPVPETDGSDASGSDAMVLLTDRAAEAAPGFRVTAANRAEVLRLCRRLEGLPLAIELAAARLRELPVQELAERLEDRFALLGETEGEMHGADPPWHQALRTAIGWSHELCTPAERLLWARLSAFAGTFDAEAARQVCADEHLPGEQVPVLLGTLVEKSVLTWQPTGGGERYRMLDTLREYGAHWLVGMGEEDRVRRRHRDCYLALARRGDAAWLGPDQFAWYDRMTAEHDNLRAALEFALTRSDARSEGHVALELAGALWFFWYGCGFSREGQHYLDRALALDTGPSRARNQALWACGWTHVSQGDADAAAARGAECVAAAEIGNDPEAAEHALAVTMCAAAIRGDLAQVVPLAEDLFTTRRHGGALTFPVLYGGVVLGHARIAQGRIEDAVTVLEHLRAACDRHGERWQRSYGDAIRAQAELARGRPEAAQEYGRAALEAKHRLHDSAGVGVALDMLAQAAAATGQAGQAAYLLGLAQHVWDTIGRSQLGVPELVAARLACEQRTREALGEHAYTIAFHVGYEAGPGAGTAHTLDHAPSR